VLAPLGLLMFILVERHMGDDAIIPHKLFKSSTFSMATILDVLVGFVVATASTRVVRHLLVTAEPVPEQPQVPAFRVTAMLDSPAQEEVFRVQIIALGLIAGDPAGDQTADGGRGVSVRCPRV
jgi:hypothetical protein